MDTMSDMNIYQRIHMVMTDVERLVKGGVHRHHKFAFLGHDDVTQALRRAFVRHGIVQRVTLLNATRIANDMVAVVVQIDWISIDDPDSRVVVESYGESSVGGKGGPNPQQSGQAVSYAVKLAMLKNFCLVGDDTEDSDMSYSPPRDTAPATLPDNDPALVLAVTELRQAASPAEARKAIAQLTRYSDVMSPELSEHIGELARAKLQA